MSGPPVLLIAGPTASGKSALALRLAQELGAEIVGADSMQIYRDLRVLTARPSPAEEARARHHLVGTADGAQAWSVGRWLEAARTVLGDLAARGKPAIVAGGTGLYFRALTNGLAMIPAVPLAARDAAEAEFNVNGEAGVRALLARLDPEAQDRIEAGDRQRLVRALAVVQHTGTPLSRWQAGTTPVLPPGGWRGYVIEPPREALYARCDSRLGAMLHQGALEEVRVLLARKLSPELPVMKAVGVREFARALAGEIPIHEALAQAQQATRNYAKRQLTWFRNQTPDWERLASADDPLSSQRHHA
jgi:tRNA dimethylallyltransferase